MPNNEHLNLEVPPAFFPTYEDHTKNAPIPRPRTERGDRVPTTAAYAIPVAGREPLDVSKYPDLIAQIEPHFPVHAKKLLHDYADKLIPAGRDVEKANNVAYADLAQRQKDADDAEADYLEQSAKIEAEQAKALEPYIAPRADLVKQIDEAREQAAKACGAIGVEARDDVSQLEILAVPVLSREKAADILNLPVNVPEQTIGAKLLALGGTLLVGTVSGVSAGLAAGILDAKSLEFQTGKLAAAALVGVGFSAFVRYAFLAIFKTAAEAKYTNRANVETYGKFAQAYLAFFAAIAMYTAMERQGLLKLADAHNAVAKLSNVLVEPVPAYVLYVMAALITFGYVAFSATQGYREGRDAQAQARIDALVDDQHNKDCDCAASIRASAKPSPKSPASKIFSHSSPNSTPSSPA